MTIISSPMSRNTICHQPACTTDAKAEEDIFRTYNLGVNSFITKPVAFDSLVRIMQTLGRYWFEIVELPDSLKKE